MRPRLLILCAAVAAMVAVWYVRGSRPAVATPTAGRTVIAFGDSLVAGVGARPGHDFVALLEARIGVPIVNAGRPGDTTATALARLDEDVLARDPRVVIVLLGGNDFMRRVPRADTFRNLGVIVARIRQRGAAVVLVGLSLGLLTDEYGDDYEALARRTSSAYVGNALEGILGHGDRLSDAIHPNDAGYAMVADRIEPSVRALVR